VSDATGGVDRAHEVADRPAVDRARRVGARSAVRLGVSTAISWPWYLSFRDGAEPVTVYALSVCANSGGSLIGNSITPPPDSAVAVGQDVRPSR
jgi:cysteine synthase